MPGYLTWEKELSNVYILAIKEHTVQNCLNLEKA
jgi:hypothetical protein